MEGTLLCKIKDSLDEARQALFEVRCVSVYVCVCVQESAGTVASFIQLHINSYTSLHVCVCACRQVQGRWRPHSCQCLRVGLVGEAASGRLQVYCARAKKVKEEG